jgi:hypothetical protein
MSEPFPDFVNQNGTAPGYEGPLYATNTWDQVRIGGQILPGIAKVSARPKLKVDPKKGGGIDGANPTIHGYDPTKIDVTWIIWTYEQWLKMQDIVPQIWPTVRKKTPQALDIYHPTLKLLNIRSCIVVSPSTWESGPWQGGFTMKIECLEFNPSKNKKATTTPTGSKTQVQVRPEYQPPNPITGANYTPANTQPPIPSQDPAATGP